MAIEREDADADNYDGVGDKATQTGTDNMERRRW